jgi:crotonobetainyl-CoA:carnitine CoA-transferase CaiB-like acyl-CoA transferase
VTDSTDARGLPLEGIRVLDLTHALAGPYCTLVLADLGADVIKLEPPEGDQARAWGPPFMGEGERTESSYFLSVNRNKRSVVLDLKSDAGRRAATILALASDVVVENFRPGTASRVGLGPEQLRAAKPELVYASISGFGQDWPSLAGYDQIAQGTSGLMSLTGAPGTGPQKVGVPIGDIAAGMFAAHAVLGALVGRHLEGGGRTIDVALNDSLLALLTYQGGRYFATGETPGQGGNHHATIAPYGTFATQDGHLNIAVGSDGQFARFCDAIAAPELLADARFGTNGDRQARRDELAREIEDRLAAASTQAWLERLQRAGVPAGSTTWPVPSPTRSRSPGGWRPRSTTRSRDRSARCRPPGATTAGHSRSPGVLPCSASTRRRCCVRWPATTRRRPRRSPAAHASNPGFNAKAAP